jgi:hypothetical protein
MARQHKGETMTDASNNRRWQRHRKLTICITPAITALALLAAAPSALAVKTHLFKETFGSVSQPDFKRPNAMTVVQATGDVLVVDTSEPSFIARFKSNGEPDPFTALGGNQIDGKRGPGNKPCVEEPASCDEMPAEGFPDTPTELQIAVDESGTVTNGNIYVTQSRARQVSIFAADGHYLGRLTKAGNKNLGESCGVSVDPAGNVYVSSYTNNAIYKYTPSSNAPSNENGAVFSTAITHPCGSAVGSGPTAGSIFVGAYQGAVYKLDLSSGVLKYVVASGPAPAPGSGLTTIALDPATGHLLAPFPFGETIEEYDVTGAEAATLISTVKPHGVVSYSPGGDIYVARSKVPNTSHIEILASSIVTLPDATTESAADVGPSKATLKGRINPDGVAVSGCFFEYGTDTAYEGTVPCVESAAEIGSGKVPVSVHAPIAGLSPGSGYHFRLVAANAGHTVFGSDEFFSTASIAKTAPATNVTGTSATLNAEVNPNGGAVTNCVFDYGKESSPAYESTVSCVESEAEIGEGTSFVPVHSEIAGLTPATKYKWRFVATTVDGTEERTGTSFSTISPVVTKPASAIGGHVATLNGTFSPGGEAVAECFFEWGRTTGFEEAPLPCEDPTAGEIPPDFGEHAVHADVSGATLATEYHFRLVVVNDKGTQRGETVSFVTKGPQVVAQWVSSVIGREAVLRAQINPGGATTTYHFEYGESASPYEHSTAESNSIGFGGTAQTVGPIELIDLEPDTVYHYRFVATSHCNPIDAAEICAAEGPDRTFRTSLLPTESSTACPNQVFRTGASAVLPDCRAYEMVSPLDKNNGDVGTMGNVGDAGATFPQAAADGQKMTFSAIRSFANPVSAPITSQYMAVRRGDGWFTSSISPPRQSITLYQVASSLSELQFKGFSEDLCSGWVLHDSDVALVPGAPAGLPNFYRRDNCGDDAYELLTTVSPPGYGYEPQSSLYMPLLQGFSEDGSRTVFIADAALTPDANPDHNFQVYEADDGGNLRLVSVLPDGSPATNHSAVGTNYGYFGRSRESSLYHAVSSDGSRVFWTDTENTTPVSGGGDANGAGDLYVRLNATEPQSQIASGECVEPGKACTIAISQSEARFYMANPEGTKAIYGARDFSTNKDDIYEFDVETATSHLIANDADFLGASEDLSHIYLTTTEALDAGAAEGEANLYLYRAADGGSFSYVATLSGLEVDFNGGSGGFPPPSAIAENPRYRTSRVTPDGQQAVFSSIAPLTDYDNTDASSGQRDVEIYRYDSTANGGEGELVCVSCNPTGARPRGRVLASLSNGSLLLWAAADIPGWTSGFRPSRAFSTDGQRLFFDSYGPLLPSDTNGKADVYQWEAPGSGDCTQGSPAFSPQNDGCLSLISSGKSPEDSGFLEATPSGSDVFFTTLSSLVVQDYGLTDVYDARVGGGLPPPLGAAPGCEGEACQGPPAPPNDPTPASSAYQGPGNPRADRAKKKKTKKRTGKHRHAHSRHKQARSKGGQGR